jgi:hypothetical protein
MAISTAGNIPGTTRENEHSTSHREKLSIAQALGKLKLHASAT